MNKKKNIYMNQIKSYRIVSYRTVLDWIESNRIQLNQIQFCQAFLFLFLWELNYLENQQNLPMIGMIHKADIIHTIPIIASARFFVRLHRYLSGDRIDQYRSNERMSKFKIDAVLAV